MNNFHNESHQEGDSDFLKRVFGEKAASNYAAKKTEKSKKSEEKTSKKNNGAKRLIKDLEALIKEDDRNRLLGINHPQIYHLPSRCVRRWTKPLPFPKI